MDFCFNVDDCLFKLLATRASSRVDLTIMVQRLDITILETGYWGQMIWKIPETGLRRWSAYSYSYSYLWTATNTFPSQTTSERGRS